jgi:hypothetical protein
MDDLDSLDLGSLDARSTRLVLLRVLADIDLGATTLLNIQALATVTGAMAQAMKVSDKSIERCISYGRHMMHEAHFMATGHIMD